MPLHLVTSNRMEVLAAELAAQLGQQPLADPFVPEPIVVQSRGMQRWLSLQLAERLGVCANIEYPFPRAFAYSLFDLPVRTRYEPSTLVWDVLALIEAEARDSALGRVCAGATDGLGRYQLAIRFARLFDRYLLYRPGWLKDWAQGVQPLPGESHARWQQHLWQRLVARCGPPQQLDDLVCRLREGPPPHMPPRLAVFGIPVLPPLYLQAFEALARYVPVTLYYLNPCRQYWEFCYSPAEIERLSMHAGSADNLYFEAGNPLLAGLARSGREFFTLLMQAETHQQIDRFVAPATDSLLHLLQRDILDLHNPAAGDRPAYAVAPDDVSVQVHVCHSAMREVEVLHDTLLDLLERSPDLEPRDIVVMAPDITEYAPLVPAVFDLPGDAHMAIPYSVADRSLGSTNAVIRLLLALFDLDRQRASAAAVLDIVNTPAVRARFNLSEHDMAMVRQWVIDVHIRWGMDAADRQRIGQPAIEEHTWHAGLQRLLLGYAMPEAGAMFDGIVPGPALSADDAAVLGRFCDAITCLFAQVRRVRTARELPAWAALLREIVQQLCAVTPETEQDLLQAIRLLGSEGLDRDSGLTGFDQPVAPDVMRCWLADQAASLQAPRGFMTRGVTFCTLLPMRSIPFKVVCLLGMQEGAFPRIQPRAGFDLLGRSWRPGDCSLRDEDRHLFLEALLSARQTLVVSYIGRSAQDNSPAPPSVVVSDLLDYIRGGCVAASGACPAEMITREHRLQPFSPAYYGADARLFTYSRENWIAPAAEPSREKIRPTAALISLEIEELAAFLANPARYVLQTRTRALLPGDTLQSLPEGDCFDPDGLVRYQLTEFLLAGVLQGHTRAQLYARLQAAGALPPGAAGMPVFSTCFQKAAEIGQRLEPLVAGGRLPPQPVAIAGFRDGVTLSGSLTDHYAGGQIFYRPGSLRAADRLRAWVFHLAACAALADPPLAATIGTDTARQYRIVARPDAQQLLQQLISLYAHGRGAPLPFVADCSLAFHQQRSAGPAAARRAAERAWQTISERDQYARWCYGDVLPVDGAFADIAQTVFGALLEYETSMN